MKPPIFLKTILDILFFLLILSVTAPLLMFIVLLFTKNPMPVEVNNLEVKNFTVSTISLITVSYLLSLVSVYIIYLLRKLVRSFFRLELYTNLQIALFNLIGQLIIFSTIVKVIINIVALIILQGSNRHEFNSDTLFDNKLFVLAVGLFFVYMSNIFKDARRMKEENELTV